MRPGLALRASTRLVRAPRASSRPQRVLVARRGPTSVFYRSFADSRSSEPPVFPGSQSQTAGKTPAPPGLGQTSPSSPSTTTVPPANVPKTPILPQKVQTTPPTSIPPTATAPSGGTTSPLSSPPPPPPRPRRRFRNFLVLTFTTLVGVYAGGTYYALHNDNFHDFFTEYIPFAEDCVLYFEERAFKRRFPDGNGRGSKMYPQVKGEAKVHISGKSGLTPRVREEKEDSPSKAKEPHNSAVDRAVAAPVMGSDKTSSAPSKSTQSIEQAKVAVTAVGNASAAKTESKIEAKSESKKSDGKRAEAAQGTPKSAPPAASQAASTVTKETIAQQSSPKPVNPIDPLNIENAADPIVQELSKILNDIIIVVNADKASEKYSSTMAKAKDSLKKIAGDMESYRNAESNAAQELIRKNHTEFEQSAKELLKRVKQEQQEQELRWREDYESERERLARGYEDKLMAEIEAAKKTLEQEMKNKLLEQDITLRKSFASGIRDQVETERERRLSKLNELSAAVDDLQNLAAKANDVVDANLQTQHLVVAVDTVRAILENADRPRPFLHELAALKEVANDDAVVNAAISSLDPSTYQRGIPTSAQLIDRFRAVATEVRKAALLPKDAGVASHAASWLLDKVLFKKQGLPTGSDVESILSRVETHLEEGELDAATREMNGLEGWAKVLSKDWVADCRRVLEVRQALDVISAEARLKSLLVD